MLYTKKIKICDLLDSNFEKMLFFFYYNNIDNDNRNNNDNNKIDNNSQNIKIIRVLVLYFKIENLTYFRFFLILTLIN